MKVSIVLPTYNRAHLIGRAIRSVLAQHDGDWELVIVDDGSTDRTSEVVAEFLKDERIKYVVKPNSGAAETRNLGAQTATAPLLTFLDSDDEAVPTWLERMKAELDGQSVTVVCCGLQRFDSTGKLLSTEVPYSMAPMFENIRGRFTNGGVYLMSRQTFLDIGGFDPLLQSGQHTELSLRLVPLLIARGEKIKNLEEPLLKVHIHGGPRIRYNYNAVFQGSSRTLAKHTELLKKDKRQYINYLSVAGVCGIRTGHYREAGNYFFKAIHLAPMRPQLWIRWIVSYIPYVRDRVWRSDPMNN